MDKKLNKEQGEAVKHDEGPLLIIAGAGTGKTTVITERIKYLITKDLAKPEEILALTFTEKAASEMESRVDEAMPLSYGDIWIMTFHGFCGQILRDEGLQIGLPSNYKLMTEAQSIDLFKKNLFNFSLDYFRPLGNPNKFISEILKHFSRLQDEVITPDEYIKFAKNYKNEEPLEVEKINELAKVYLEYNQLKLDKNFFDFGDLIIKTIELFQKRPNILKKFQDKFKYILVDEFQDTNYAQNELVKLLVSKYQNITVVGDDDQSIYRFRGASISNIIQFRKTFPKTKIIVLNKNYRSTQEILDRSYDLIQHNNPDRLEVVEGISKKLVAIGNKRLEKREIGFIHAGNSDEESQEVVREISDLIANGQSLITYSDFAILVRANAHADPFIRELERAGIPHQFLGPSKLFEKEEIVDLISYLKVLYNPEDSESFYRLISSNIFDISPLELIKISVSAKRKSISIFEEILESENKVIKKLLDLINKHLKLIKTNTAGEILYEFLNEFEIYQKILESEDDIKAKNISKFFERIKSYENENPKALLPEIVDYIDLLSEVGESPIVSDTDWSTNNAVNILTIHSAKGLEFPIVFLVNLVSERFPSRNKSEQIPIPDELIKEQLPQGDFHLQEERRLFYVGMTRAKERLYLTASDFYGDGKRKKKISQFVMEALGEVAISSMPYAISSKEHVTKIETIKHKAESIKLNFLSVSQIETFQTCPMHYKLKYIYKLPTPINQSISFGLSIHKTLREYIETNNNILKIYKNNWIEEGYINKKHKLEFYKLGEKYLTEFAEKNKKINNIALEKNFKFKIDKNLTVGGVIDRIDKLGEEYLEIIDYKTGDKIPTQKDVDKNLQLSVYAMAVSDMYKIDPENIKLTLYYLKDQTKISINRTVKDLEKVKEEILKVKEEIENSDFKCSNDFFCQNGCDYSLFCKSETF